MCSAGRSCSCAYHGPLWSRGPGLERENGMRCVRGEFVVGGSIKGGLITARAGPKEEMRTWGGAKRWPLQILCQLRGGWRACVSSGVRLLRLLMRQLEALAPRGGVVAQEYSGFVCKERRTETVAGGGGNRRGGRWRRRVWTGVWTAAVRERGASGRGERRGRLQGPPGGSTAGSGPFCWWMSGQISRVRDWHGPRHRRTLRGASRCAVGGLRTGLPLPSFAVERVG